MSSPALEAIAALPQPELKSVFLADPNRLSKFTLTQGPLRFDWSKTHLTSETLAGFLKLAEEMDFTRWRDAFFAGEPINNSEGRAAEHPAERGEGCTPGCAR